MAKGGKRVPARVARTELDALREYANSLAPQKGFFSTLDEAISNAPFERAPVSEWRNFLQPGRMVSRDELSFPIKKEELEYTQLLKALDAMERGGYPKLPLDSAGSVDEILESVDPAALDKGTLLETLRQHRPEFRVRVSRGDYGGEQDRMEQLIGPYHLRKDQPPRASMFERKFGPERYDYLSHQTPGSTYEESVTGYPDIKGDNRWQHFQRDALSHSRTTSHRLPSGLNLRLVEEIQSDLHERAHDRWGDVDHYATDDEISARKANEADRIRLANLIDELNEEGRHAEAGDLAMQSRELLQSYRAMNEEIAARRPRRGYAPEHAEEEMKNLLGGQRNNGAFRTPDDEIRYDQLNAAVSDAPFKDPAEYARLELRKQLLNAVNQNEDYLALTTGDQQVQRYSMEDGEMDPKRAEGMRYVYDKINRGELERLAKQYGAQIEDVSVLTEGGADIRPPIMQEIGVEDIRGLMALAQDSERTLHGAAHRPVGSLVRIIDELNTPDTPPELIAKARRELEAVRKASAAYMEDPEASQADLDYAIQGYQQALEGMFNIYSQHMIESNPELKAQATRTFPALRLTPEVRERIKRIGVPIWSLAGGAMLLDGEEEPVQKFDKGGGVGKRAPTLADQLADITEHAGHGFRTQWMGLDETGTPRGALYNDWDAPKDQWEFNSEAQMLLPPQRSVRPGIVDETIGLPAFFGFGPEASFEASDRVQELDTALRAQYDVEDPSSWPDYIGEAAGVMGGQVPMPSGMFKGAAGALGKYGKYVPDIVKSAANSRLVRWPAKAASAVSEWFMPTIEPKLSNYAMGTAAGAVLTKFLPELVASEEGGEEIDWSDPNLEFQIDAAQEAGEITPEEADELYRIVAAERGNLEAPETEEPEMTTGGGFAKGGRIYTGRKPLLSNEQLAKAHDMYAEGMSIAQIAETMGVPYPRLYKRLTRAGLAPVTPIVRNELTPEARLEALQRVLAGETQRSVAEDLGVTGPAISLLKKRAGEIEGHAKGGLVKFRGLKKRLLERKDQLDREFVSGLSAEQLEANDRKNKELWDLIYKLEDTESENELAKGGKVKPGETLKLRQRLAELMSEAGVEGTGKELVPTDPLPTDPNMPAPDTNLPNFEITDPLPDTNRPGEGPTVSRRSVLKGMRDLASAAVSPVDLSLNLDSLARSVEAPVAAAAKSLTPAQVANRLSSIWETMFGMSDDAIEDLLVAAEEAKQLPGSEGLVSLLNATYKKLDEVGNQSGGHDEYAKVYHDLGYAAMEEMNKIADSHGVVSLPERYEDFGDVESGPQVPTMVEGPRWVEPPEGGRQVLDDTIQSYENTPGEDLRPEDRATLNDLKKLRDHLGNRADAVFAEFMMHNLPKGQKYQIDQAVEDLGLDVGIFDAFIDAAESKYVQWGSLEDWASASPETRQRYRDLRDQLTKIAEAHPYDSPPGERELMEQYHRTWDDIFPNSRVDEDPGTAYEAEVRARQISNDLKLDDEEQP